MNNLVISTLHKSGVNCYKRSQSLRCHTSSHSHCMLLRNANIKRALRKSASKNVHSSTTWHSSSNTNDRPIFSGCINERIGKNRRKTWRRHNFFLLHTCRYIKFSDPMHFITCRFCGWVSESFVCLYVKQYWFVAFTVTEFLHNGNHIIQVMSIDWAHIVKSKLLKERTTTNDTTGILIKTFVNVLHIIWKQAVEALGKVTKILEWLGYKQVGSVGRKLGCWHRSSGTWRTSWKTDLTVIIENHNHAVFKVSSTIHRFVRHSPSNSPVSDDRYTIISAFVQHRLGNTHTLCRRDTGGRVTSTKGIVITFASFAESRQSS
mmetsp:Transcript_1023/g.1121  ORF Transcript_1023/g.1121 Transcript_1023/m.1121 type:complete len:319 (+) Transcript_1023:244-1200(+)